MTILRPTRLTATVAGIAAAAFALLPGTAATAQAGGGILDLGLNVTVFDLTMPVSEIQRSSMPPTRRRWTTRWGHPLRLPVHAGHAWHRR